MGKPRRPGPSKQATDLGEHGIGSDLVGLARPVGDFDLMPGNPRHGDVEAIARSYREFGQTKPIVVWRGELPAEPGVARRYVIDGNHQLLAAVDLGWDSVAVSDVSHLPLEKALAYAAFVNRVPDLGTIDEGALADLLSEVELLDSDLLDASGYTSDDLAELLLAGESVDDAVLTTTPGEDLDNYLGAAIRSIVLPYGPDDYDNVQRWMALARSDLDAPDNATVIYRLLENQCG